MPFLRGGWADDGDSRYEASVRTGFGNTRPVKESGFP
jgi:hypothetical protein